MLLCNSYDYVASYTVNYGKISPSKNRRTDLLFSCKIRKRIQKLLYRKLNVIRDRTTTNTKTKILGNVVSTKI